MLARKPLEGVTRDSTLGRSACTWNAADGCVRRQGTSRKGDPEGLLRPDLVLVGDVVGLRNGTNTGPEPRGDGKEGVASRDNVCARAASLSRVLTTLIVVSSTARM